MATSNGLRPSPATQCTAMAGASSGVFLPLNCFFCFEGVPYTSTTTCSHFFVDSRSGTFPSGNGMSVTGTVDRDASYDGRSVIRTTRTTFSDFQCSQYAASVSSIGVPLTTKRIPRYGITEDQILVLSSSLIFLFLSPAFVFNHKKSKRSIHSQTIRKKKREGEQKRNRRMHG